MTRDSRSALVALNRLGFGARGGAAFGVGLSLGTTVVFLVLIQLTRAIGGKGLVQPELAAWIPSALFGVTGLFLLARTRT